MKMPLAKSSVSSLVAALFMLPVTGLAEGDGKQDWAEKAASKYEQKAQAALKSGNEKDALIYFRMAQIKRDAGIATKAGQPFSWDEYHELNKMLEHAGKPAGEKKDTRKDKPDVKKHKTDPRKDKTDPRKHKNDPRKDKTDPRKDKTDPRKDKTDPRKHKNDPRKDKNDPRKDKTDPRKDKNDPRKDRADVRKERADARKERARDPKKGDDKRSEDLSRP